MKAIKLTNPGGEVAVTEVEVPQPGRGEILVKVEASGLCFTDVHLCDNDWAVVESLVKQDLTLGHEAVGRVEALGEGVENRTIGERVIAPFLRSACGLCKQCRRGEENLCPNATILGMTHDGSHAEYFTAVADYVVPVPDGVTPEQAAPLACAGMSVLGGLRNANVSVGTKIAVIGVGGQGHLAVQLAKVMGAAVYAVDISPDKVKLALEAGADEAYDATQEGTLESLTEIRPDVVMVTAPSHEAHSLALAIVDNGGIISLCAVPGGETPISLTVCAFKGVKLLTQAAATRQELIDILDLAVAGKVTCEVETRPLDAGPDAIAQLRESGVVGRIVFVP